MSAGRRGVAGWNAPGWIYFFALGLVGLAQALGPQTGQAAPPAQVPGEVLVQFRPGTPRQRLEEILAELNLRLGKSLGTPGAFVLKFSAPTTVEEVIRRLKQFPEVRLAEPNRYSFTQSPPATAPRETRP